MKIRQLHHSTYQVNYHLVWGTKYRRKFLKPYVRSEIIKCLFKLQKKYPTWYFERVNTDDDHIHVLMAFPPSDSIAAVVKVIKMTTNFHITKTFPFVKKIYRDGSIWSVGYFVSTIGLNEETIRRYIDLQGQGEVGKDVTDLFSCQ